MTSSPACPSGKSSIARHIVGLPSAVEGDPASSVLLRAEGVTVQFGGVTALSEVDLSVAQETIVGLVGPNGAGKSTLFGVLSGLVRSQRGTVHLGGRDITGLQPQARARQGLARTFQHPELFPELTVREHLSLASRMRFDRRRLWSDLVNGRPWRRESSQERAGQDEILEMLSLTEVADSVASGLPLGTSRLVEVARAVSAKPSVMLLDEPTSGLDVAESERLAAAIQRVVSATGAACVLVEHDVEMVLSLAQFIYVLDFGRVIAEGSPHEIRRDERVQSAYLGREWKGAPQDDG
jgi:ABC-type branched-subunit amino acid transport system ATPase component